MSATISSRKEAEDALIAKARQDPTFKDALVANPRAVIKTVLGIDLPPGVDVSVLQETSRSLYLVIPASSESGELADEELASVAGGKAKEELDKQQEAANTQNKSSILGSIFG